MNINEIARVCHEVNRAYCEALGDFSQVSWENSPYWQRDSVEKGVRLHIGTPETGPEDSHESWMEEKRRDGWVYGETKDEVAKTHPCFRPFHELPREQKAKDFIFKAIVVALT